MNPMKWTSRAFEFTLQEGVYPCVVERLRGAPVRIEELTANVPHELLTKRDGERWSFQEHIGHLLDLDDLHERRLDEFLQNAEKLSPADMTNRKTWQAHHNQTEIAALLEAFRENRLRFVARLEAVSEEVVGRTAQHPRLKQPMRLIDMVYFTAEHDDHHIALMRAILNTVS